jgi:spermidine synthase
MKEKSMKRSAPSQGGHLVLAPPLATAFITGTACLLVEVIGARALAPFFGSSLMVWTAQITATLLFLAVGYEVGGRITRKPSPLHLPMLLFVAAAWLALYPMLRAPVLSFASMTLGVTSGSFLSATILFGVPLLCIGAVSPVLVSHIDRSRPGAGSAAGSLFFISTLGGLAGGWIAVFVVIPYFSVRLCIVGTGAILAALGIAWALRRRATQPAAVLCVATLAGGLALAVPPGPTVVRGPKGAAVKILYSRESDEGLVRVIDTPAFPPRYRVLFIDGIAQGVMRLDSGECSMRFMPYIYDLDRLGRLYDPWAKNALLLGLGAGLLAKQLHEHGLHVRAIELDRRVVYVARTLFRLPAAVDVQIADARTFLRTDRDRYDLIYLDVFAAENVPWYLTTVETFRDVKARLRPGGRLLINSVTNADGNSVGLARMRAGLRRVFPHALVWLGKGNGGPLANAIIVAGADLRPSDSMQESSWGLTRVDSDVSAELPGTDDWDDIDYAEADLREEFRREELVGFGPKILGE